MAIERKIIIEGNIAKIPLGENAKHGYAIIDAERADEFGQYLWCANKGYAIRRMPRNNKHIHLHQCIIGKAPEGLVIDHINRNSLDNRKSNLRFVTQKFNMRNTGMYSHKTSGHKCGVWDKSRDKWAARIKSDGVHINLGRFGDIKEAVKARKKAEEKYHGI